jgi:CHAD domain-containing protein
MSRQFIGRATAIEYTEYPTKYTRWNEQKAGIHRKSKVTPHPYSGRTIRGKSHSIDPYPLKHRKVTERHEMDKTIKRTRYYFVGYR